MRHAKTAFRSVALLTVFGLFLVPEGASAIGRQRPWFAGPPKPACPPVQAYRPACPPPVYYYYCPQPPLAPPTVKPDPVKPATPKAALEAPSTIRPAGDATPIPAVPPTIVKSEAPTPTIPPTKLRLEPSPIVPAIPSPAVPAPFGLLDPVVPEIKPSDAPKIPPPLVPPLSIPDLSSSTSKSSPLTGRPKSVVDIFPVDGPAPESPSSLRKVVIFNHADRDVKLTLACRSVTLPKKHSITADVPASFEWKLDDEATRTIAIPTAAPGVDIVIRK